MVKTRKVIKRRRDGVVQGYHIVPQAQQKQIVRDYLENIGTDLKRQGRANIQGIGILSKKIVPAKPSRMGINPFTKETMRFKKKPRQIKVKFRASKAMKELLN